MSIPTFTQATETSAVVRLLKSLRSSFVYMFVGHPDAGFDYNETKCSAATIFYIQGCRTEGDVKEAMAERSRDAPGSAVTFLTRCAADAALYTTPAVILALAKAGNTFCGIDARGKPPQIEAAVAAAIRYHFNDEPLPELKDLPPSNVVYLAPIRRIA